MATKGTRTQTDSTTTQKRALRRQGKLRDSPERQSLGLSAVDPQAIQVGMALARQHGQINPLADACKEILKPPAIEMQLGRVFATESLIEQMVATGRQRLQQTAVGISAAKLMNPLLEAERERQKRLEAALNPCRGLLEGLRSQTSGWERIAEASTASFRRLAETCSPRLPSMEIGLGIDAIDALRSVGGVARLADLHGEMRIHAVPLLAPRLWRPQESEQEESPPALFSPQPAPERSSGLLDAGVDSEDSQRLLEELIQFQRSDEIPSDAREGMSQLNTWWKLNRHRITPDQSLEFNRIVQRFIGSQLGLTAAPDSHQQLCSGLLVPQSQPTLPAPDLAPEVYTTKQLSALLPTTTDTLKRHARNACRRGPLPQPLQDFPDWFVVSRSDPQGGQNRGWKFQKLRTSEAR